MKTFVLLLFMRDQSAKARLWRSLLVFVTAAMLSSFLFRALANVTSEVALEDIFGRLEDTESLVEGLSCVTDCEELGIVVCPLWAAGERSIDLFRSRVRFGQR
jgi:hypothetical protein